MKIFVEITAIMSFLLAATIAQGGESTTKQATGPKNYWALVIGIADYLYPESGLNNLKYASNDADAIEKMLLTQGWSKERINKVTNKDATRKNLEALINGWLRKVSTEDMLLIYWAGHGYPDLADQRRVYFACYDTDMKKPWTGYRMDKVVNTIREHGIRNVVFIADTCHAGKIVTRSDGSKGLSIKPYLDDIPRNANLPPGWIFMAATEAGRPTVENDHWKNGVFTYCLLRGMSGEAGVNNHGLTDMAHLRDYLQKTVPRESRKVSNIELKPVITTSAGKSNIWDMTFQLGKEAAQ